MSALCARHTQPRQADAGQLCSECVGRTRRQLLDMPALHDLLAAFLEPGTNGDDGPSGHRANPPLPVNVDALSLRQRGGILASLATWEDDWRDIRGDRPAKNRGDNGQAVRAVVAWLDGHLGWAAKNHPAIDEFSSEIAQLWRQAWSVAGLTRPPVVADAPCFAAPDVDDSETGEPIPGDPCGGDLVKFWRDGSGLDETWECQLCGTIYDDDQYHQALRDQLEKEREHGTRTAYMRHWRRGHRGQEICEPCRLANAEATATRRARELA